VVCVLEQLHRALNNRNVFASPSHRWSDPRARLLDGAAWEAVCEDVLAGLSLDMPVAEHLEELVRALDAGWKQMAERLESAGKDAKVSLDVQPNGRVKLNVEKLGALGEPKSLAWLRKRVEKMLPKIDLPDLLFEVHSWTGFLDAFVHLGDGTTRMRDLTTSVVALLVSEACNIGMTPVTNSGHEALTRSRLVHVDQFYLRAVAFAAANAILIEARSEVPIVAYWGTGCWPRSTGCGSSSRSARSARRRRRSTSGSSAASPGSTPSTTRSRASGRWSSPAPRVTPCTSWTPC
jgi:hypothetical protein